MTEHAACNCLCDNCSGRRVRALWEYVLHKANCPRNMPSGPILALPDCTCGLDALRAGATRPDDGAFKLLRGAVGRYLTLVRTGPDDAAYEALCELDRVAFAGRAMPIPNPATEPKS